MTDAELQHAIEIVKDRLFWVSLRSVPRNTNKAHFFCTDNELVYWNFFLDFGPLNLGQLYRFCQRLNALLSDKRLANKRIYYYSSTHSHKRTNSAFLVTAYTLLFLGRSPEEAYRPFRGIYPPLPPFHDASPCVCTYTLTVFDCLKAIDKARANNFFNFENFDIDEYEHFEKVENGDLNWIIQDRVLQFAGPHDQRATTMDGYVTLVPEDYIPYFKQKGVKLVIRLNKKYYDERRFTREGISHRDMYYLDGSCPPDYILRNFLEECEKVHHTGAIAVHCKAGLGRAGTTVGCFIMKHYGFAASELIAWSRICRPGCIIGPQQHFLKEMEQRMWKAGELYRKRRKEAQSARSGSASPYGSDGSPNGGALSNAMGGLTVQAPGNTTPTRSSLGAAGAAMVTGSPASPKGQLKGDGRDHSQGDNLRGRAAQSPKQGGSGGAYGTRGAQRGLFGR